MPEHVLIGRYPHMTRDSIPHTTDLTENVSSLFFFFSKMAHSFQNVQSLFKDIIPDIASVSLEKRQGGGVTL